MAKPAQAKNNKYASLVLRFGLAFVFVYAAISSFRRPDVWIGYIPSFTTHLLSAKASLDAAGVIQLILALALVIGKYVKYAALISGLLLAGIVVFNLSSLLITFRDVGLVCMAAALYFLSDGSS